MRWYLADGTPVQEPRRSITPEEIDLLRANYRILSVVQLRPLEAGESATDPPAGWVAVHEHQFKCGLMLSLHPWVQQTLSALNVVVGQVTHNMWKQLLGMYVIWDLSGLEWLTYDEVVSSYKLAYSG